MTTPRVHIGMTWNDAKGRVWEVVENLYFGRWRCVTTDKRCVVDMQGKAILSNTKPVRPNP